MMKKILSILLLSTLTFSVMANTALPKPKSSAEKLNSIVAIVNSDVITKSELDQALERTKAQIHMSGANLPNPAALYNGVLDQLIYQKLTLELAERAKIDIPEKHVDAAIDRIVKGNKTTLTGLKAKLKQEGISFNKFRSDIKQQLLIQQVQREAVGHDVTITDHEIEAFIQNYNTQPDNGTKYHVVDVLVAFPDNASAQQKTAARKEAAGIAAQLKKGADFSHLADHDDTDLGYRTLADIPTLFANHIKKMKIDEVAGPIEAPNGFHVLQVEDIKTSKKTAPTKEQVRQLLFRQKFEKAVEKWLKEIRKTAYVHINE